MSQRVLSTEKARRTHDNSFILIIGIEKPLNPNDFAYKSYITAIIFFYICADTSTTTDNVELTCIKYLPQPNKQLDVH